MTSLTDPLFTNEDAARAHFEKIRWPDGKPVCPHCGGVDQATRLEGKSHRPGLFVCRACREHFTVTVGTVMESSHVPLHKWALGFHLMASSKKGISAHQLMRNLGLGSYRTAWFMAHRIREAMADRDPKPLGGKGKKVEVDETYFGKTEVQPTVTKEGKPYKSRRRKFGQAGKRAVIALVERGGSVRTFHVDKATKVAVASIVSENIDRETSLCTDESALYPEVGKQFADHATVRHSADEYVRGDVHTNTVEGYFSIFKRGMKGVYQHCGEKHLHRYLAEFDFRYSNRVGVGVDDSERSRRAIRGAESKRLKYR